MNDKAELLEALETALGVKTKLAPEDELAKINGYLDEGNKAYIELIDIFTGAAAAAKKAHFTHPELRDRILDNIALDQQEMLAQLHKKFSALFVRRSQILAAAGTKLDRLN